MADLTRADMIAKVMRYLRVLGAGQTAQSRDSTEVGRILDSVHDQLVHRGLVNFPTTAFPEWGQEPFTKVLAFDVAPYFGVPPDIMKKKEGMKELASQMRGRRKARPIEAKYY